MSIKLNSTLGGSVTLQEPNTASAFTLTLPTDNIQPGMNLITPTSVVGGTFSGGAISFSASTSVSINGCFSSLYDNYLYQITYTAASGADAQMRFRLRVAGVDSIVSYINQRIYAYSTVIGTDLNIGGTTSLFIGSITTGYPQAASCQGTLFSPALIQQTRGNNLTNHSDSSGNYYNQLNNHYHTVSAAYDGMTIFPSTGTVTGTMRIYGMRSQ
jgi:hypothetical protein